MRSNKRNYFGKELRALKLSGVSLYGDDSLPYKIYSVLLLLPTICLYPVLNFYEYFKHDTSAIVDIVPYQMGTFLDPQIFYNLVLLLRLHISCTLPSHETTNLTLNTPYILTALCKVTILLRNRVKFGKLLAKLELAPFAPNIDRGGELEEELIGECVKWTSVQTYIFWTFATVTLFLTIITTAAKRVTNYDSHDWLMPFGPFTLFNATYSPYYELDLFYQSVSCTYIACHYITTDLILAAVLAHITYQFKLLQNGMNRIVETARKKMIQDTNCIELKSSNNSILFNESDGSGIPWTYLNKSLVEAVQYHVAIIDVAKEIENVFSYLLLVVFLGTLVLMCFFTFYASSARTHESAARYIADGLIACGQVAMVCFWGEQVFQESQLVAEAAYETNFVGTDLRFQKMLALIICRSQVPIKITAGKFANISLAAFAWVLRTSYSYFIMLRNINN